ncbi:acyl carrier protein phosphodiesterase [Halocola ammonii]
MNYLAHLFLSGDDPDLLVGNFIGDAVKGNKFEDFPPAIARGVLLHRFIDDFSDHHPSALKTRKRLRSDFGLWSPVITDMFYDHFLAANWSDFSNEKLEAYTEKTYSVLNSYKKFFPENMKMLLHYMSKSNWLLNYSKIEGIERSLNGMSSRIEAENNLHLAGEELRQNYDLYESDFLEFFPKIQQAVAEDLREK